MEKTNITQLLVMSPGGNKKHRELGKCSRGRPHLLSEFPEKYPGCKGLIKAGRGLKSVEQRFVVEETAWEIRSRKEKAAW